MASQLRHDYPHEGNDNSLPGYTRVSSSGSRGRSTAGRDQRELRLNLQQLIVVWSAVVGLMVAIFLVGFFAGQKHGKQVALEDVSQNIVRLPLQGQETGVGSAESALAKSSGATGILAKLNLGKTAEQSAKQASASKERRAESVQDGSATIGLAARPAKASGSASAGANETVELAAASRALRELDVRKSASETSAAENKLSPAEAKLREAAKKSAGGGQDSVGEAKARQKKTTTNATAQKQPVRAKIDAPTPRAVLPAQQKTSTGEQRVARLLPGFYVQVAAPSIKADAYRLGNKFVGRGYRAVIQEAALEKGTFYRVLIGPYRTSSKARAAREKITATRVSTGTPFVRRVY